MQFAFKVTFVGVLLIAVLGDTFAQQSGALTSRSASARRSYQQATEAWGKKDFQNTVNFLQRALRADPRFLEAKLLLGEVYFSEEEFAKSIPHFLMAVQTDPLFFPQAQYFLARAYLRTGDYVNAKLHFEQLLQSRLVSARLLQSAQAGLVACIFAIHAQAHPVAFEPVNMGSAINTNLSEYSPALTVDEQTLIFTRKVPDVSPQGRGNRFQEDFFKSYFQQNAWEPNVPLGEPVNSWWNEGAQTITADGRQIIFASCNRPGGMGSCDLYSSSLSGMQWSQPENLGPVVNSSGWDSQPSLSSDGRTLFFTSNRAGGNGLMDIWFTTRPTVADAWTAPQNLGHTINTPYREMSPFIHADNHTLYFASDGHLGMGGLDLFVCRRDSANNWAVPVNLGYPLNTFADEFSLVVGAKGTQAFFASAREGGFGKNDLYMFALHEEVRPTTVTYLKGVVFDYETRNRIGARFHLINLKSGENIMESYSDTHTGEFLVALPTGMPLALNVEHAGYLFFSEHFSLEQSPEGAEPVLMNIALNPVKTGETVVMRNIFFDTGSHYLKPESVAELLRLFEFLSRNPKIRIEIGGHTDNVGTFEFNTTLSHNRARSVVNFLVDKGISANRLSYKGFADTKPIDTNNTEQGRANNRRTEFTLIP